MVFVMHKSAHERITAILINGFENDITKTFVRPVNHKLELFETDFNNQNQNLFIFKWLLKPFIKTRYF